MNHRKWEDADCNRMYIRSMVAKHNALYADWKKSSLEVERLAKVNGDLCDKIAELERPIRVPFSDEAIEKMARVAHNAYSDYWIAQEIPILDYPRDQLFMRWEEEGEHMQASRIAMIRAALAAGGIEPCTPPDYAPEDVAFPAERASDDELGRFIHDKWYDCEDDPSEWRKEIDNRKREWVAVAAAVRARVEAPLLAEIERLERRDTIVSEERAEAEIACNTLKSRVAELEATKKIPEVAELLARRPEEPVSVAVMRLRNQRNDLFNKLSSRDERIADLVAQLQAVTAERDESSASRERLMLLVEQQAQELQDDPQFRECRKDLGRAQQDLAALRAQLEAVTAEGDELKKSSELLAAVYRGEMDARKSAHSQLAALRQRDAVPVKVRFDVTAALVEEVFSAGDWAEYSWQAVIDYLAAHAVIDVPNGVGQTPHVAHEPTDAEIEALARVLCETFYRCGFQFSESTCQVEWCNAARAAFAHIGRVPVGAELDVKASELYKVWDSTAILPFEAVLDLCRSRIRPVYECKECAETRKHYNDLGAIMQQVADLSRTAMDGE